jgi:hypothetical protein
MGPAIRDTAPFADGLHPVVYFVRQVGFVFGSGNERCPHSFGLLEIGESGALSGNDISPRRASHYSNRTITLHPKAPRRVGQSGLVHLASRGVALVQNDGLICLRHPQTVPVLVQSVDLRPESIEFVVLGSPHWTRFELLRLKFPSARTQLIHLSIAAYERKRLSRPVWAPRLDQSRTAIGSACLVSGLPTTPTDHSDGIASTPLK